MAIIAETSLRAGLQQAGVHKHEIDDLIAPKAVPFPQVPNGFVVYPGFVEWLADFDDHTAQQLMQPTNSRLWTLLHTRDRYRRMKRAYEKRVLDDLQKIQTASTGSAILKEIQAASNRTVSIIPHFGDNDGDYNADAAPDDPQAATHVGMPLLNGDGDYLHPLAGSGTGKGSDVDVHFSPEIWGVFADAPRRTNGGRCTSSCSKPTGPGSESDEILFHELVHAGRMMRGLRYHLPVNQGYDNEEEFLAVVITNIYMSETNYLSDQLRANHSGHDILANPERFLDNPQHVSPSPRRLLERLRLIQPSLFKALADIETPTAWFNPVYDYNDELKKGMAKPA